MLIKVNTFKLNGYDGIPVACEVDVVPGVGIHLVGLADNHVKETLLRTLTAMESIGYHVPGKKIVINIAPADLRKSGDGYDLPVAIGIIAASGQRKFPDIDKYVIAGELGLDGSLRDIPGWIQCAEVAASLGLSCIMPTECAKLAANVLRDDVKIYGADDLKEVIDILEDGAPDWTAQDECEDAFESQTDKLAHVWDTIKGHDGAKRGLEIAAAGNHPLIMVGPAPAGKIQLAYALRDILPATTRNETLEIMRIYSAADKRPHMHPAGRPLRNPHWSASMAAWFGGGVGETIRPGEVSLAHNGILVINELQCLPNHVKDALRGPIEDKQLTISRLKCKTTYPADFLPVVLSNPCPCGYYGTGDKCTCTKLQRKSYLSKLSGPIMDHITIQTYVNNPINTDRVGEPMMVVAERVAKARARQIERQGKLNEYLDRRELGNFCFATVKNFLEDIMVKMNFNMRAYYRILKIARTIADLEGVEELTTTHIAEAASYRFLDRFENI